MRGTYGKNEKMRTEEKRNQREKRNRMEKRNKKEQHEEIDFDKRGKGGNSSIER